MVDFGGWDMPVIYTNQIEEHHAVRNSAGLFDVSHMGEIMVTGKNAFDVVQKVVTKDISKMSNGKVILGIMCNEQGGILDDLTVYKYADEKYMLVVNAGTATGDYEWIRKYSKEFIDVQIENQSNDITKIDIQGPKAQSILQQLTDTNLEEIRWYWFKELDVNGALMTVSRTGYTGEDGFELYMLNEYAQQIWDKLLVIGKEDGLIACGLGSRDTLRTECGMMLYGHDIDTKHTPFEGVYSFAVSMEKDFIGRAALAEQQAQGIQKKLVGFEMLDRGIAREHYPIYFEGEEVGEVTSGTPSPTLEKNIGMGYIDYDLSAQNIEIDIKVRDRFVKAKIVKMPFYKPRYKR